MHKKQILISGSSGFVGKNLVTYLEAKDYALTRLNLRDEHWETTLDKRSFKSYIHLAGIAHDLSKKKEESLYYEVNCELTKQLYKCFLKDDKADLFIFFSSVKAVSDQPNSIVTEEMQPAPKTVYGKSKLQAEQYILQHLHQDKTVIILRPCMIHGPGNKGNLNSLIKLVKLNIPWMFAAFQNKRSYLSLENACYIIDRIITKKEIKSGIYNMADDVSLSTNTLIQLIAEALGEKPRLWKLPKWMINSASRLGDLLQLPVNSQVLNKVTGTYEVSNQKIKNELGIKNLPISAEKGLIHTITSYDHD